ncbi:MAG TPA: ABC transporter permease [Planctomycetaceae bacterium]|nr:ABC transporter permease [Planctomycetaceae bacterium]
MLALTPALRRRCELIALLARKEWHIRYRSAKLGYAWAVVQPLMLMVVMLIVFDYVLRTDREAHPETNPYPLFLLSGLFPWHFASVAFSSATPSFNNSRKLILLASFPRDVLPLGVVTAHLVNLLLTLPLLLPLYLFYWTSPSWWVLALPLPIILQTVILGGMALIAALICVRFTDTFFLVQALLLPWYFGTPILYSRAAAGALAPWLWLNPLTGVMELYRLCLMPDWPVDQLPASLAAATLWACGLAALSAWLLRRTEATIADWI